MSSWFMSFNVIGYMRMQCLFGWGVEGFRPSMRTMGNIEWNLIMSATESKAWKTKGMSYFFEHSSCFFSDVLSASTLTVVLEKEGGSLGVYTCMCVWVYIYILKHSLSRKWKTIHNIDAVTFANIDA